MPNVVLYALSTCPWCRRAKKFFDERNIPYECVDYDLADAETKTRVKQEMDEAGVSSFPFVRIDDHVIAGYKPEAYTEHLGL